MSTEELEIFELEIPASVTVSYADNKIEVSGPKGNLVRDISKIPAKIEISDKVKVIPYNNRKRSLAIANTLRSLIKNMINGVVNGYRYKLKIIYSHFPITVKVKDNTVLIENFIGERAPRVAKIQGDCKVKVDGEDVIIEGISLDDVSQTAANIELATKIKNKDLRVFLDGIYIYEKEK